MQDDVLWWCRSGLIRGLALAVFIAISPAVAIADGGAVRASKRVDNWQITVFTEPTPLRAGPADVSVFVQDVNTGQPIFGSLIEIATIPRGRSSEAVHHTASSDAASNKLFQAAHFNLPTAGGWNFTVTIQRPTGNIEIHFELDVADSLPPWRSLWLWFCWPFFAVALFFMSRPFHKISRTSERSPFPSRQQRR